MGLQGVMLFVKDLERMTTFYRDVLALEPVEATRLDNRVEFEGDGGRRRRLDAPDDFGDGPATARAAMGRHGCRRP